MLGELVPQDHFCRILDLFVDLLDMARLGFDRAEPAETDVLVPARSAEVVPIRILAADPLLAVGARMPP